MINETYISVSKYAKSPHSRKRFKALLEMLVAFLPIIVLGTIGTILGGGTLLGGMLINLGYVLSILVVAILLKRQGSSWLDIGLARPKNWLRTVLLGFGAAIVVIVMMLVVSNIALNLPGAEVAEADMSRFNPLEGNLPLLLISVFLAWTAVAFGEEMMYRAFLINQLGVLFQSERLRWVLSVIFSSVIFGIVHFYQGPLGILNTFIIGLLFGVIYLRSGRNLWVTIIAHGLINTLTFVLVFYGVA
jgi:membrane protease YdiL (CAAX protease family)